MTGSGEATFAAALRRLREERSLTQEELAERAGITAKAVGALERGERTRPYPHTVRALADALALDDDARAALSALVPGRGASPPAAAATAPSAPLPTSSLIGRDAEVRAVRELFAAGHRLVTLTGPGGIGKTRIALEVAGGRPAVFVELADVRDPELLLHHLAASLGIPETTATGRVDTLVPALSGRPVFVVLDNLEQLLPAAASTVADLVAHCPDLVVLVTSRAALRVRAERELVVAPLATSDAVALFAERAAAAGADVPFDEPNAVAVASLCQQLDGIPLALELAAAGSRVLTPVVLLERLDRQEPSATLHDLADRQRSMAAAIDWSLELLDDDGVALFRRLAVFDSGFSLDAAAAVAEADDVLLPLGSLVAQSLLTRVASPDGRPRFRLLEPVRQYAGQLLAGSPDASDAADRQAAWFHDWAMEAGARLRGPDLALELDLLAADHGNLRSSYTRLREHGRLADATEMVGSIWLYLALRGHAREALAWLDGVDPARAGLPDVSRCRAVVGHLGLLFATGDIASMQRVGADAVTLARRQPDAALAAEVLTLAGHAAVFAGDLDAARELLDQALERPADAGADGRWIRVHTLVAQGQLALARGEGEVADQVLAHALELARELGTRSAWRPR